MFKFICKVLRVDMISVGWFAQYLYGHLTLYSATQNVQCWLTSTNVHISANTFCIGPL